MNDKRMIIGTGMSEVHLEFASIPEKKEWLVAIDECKKRLNFGMTSIMTEHTDYQDNEEVKGIGES
jgi:hypothetical protein